MGSHQQEQQLARRVHLIMRLLGVCLLVTIAALSHAAPHTVQKRVANLPLVPGDSNVSSLSALKAAHKAALQWGKLEKRKLDMDKRKPTRETSHQPMRETSHQPMRQTSHQVSKSSHSVYSNVDG